MKMVVLSIDGGGIKGIIPATILSYLEKQITILKESELQDSIEREHIIDYIDLVAGTSTGALIGGMMVLPSDYKSLYNMDDITKQYLDLGEVIFKSSFINKIKTLFGFIGPKYPATNIEKPLLKIFDHYKLGESWRPCMFTGYDIDKRRVNIYTSHDVTRKYANYYLKDILRGTTAAPTYFPPAYFRDGIDINFIADGGVFSNNPSMCAYVEASKMIAIKHPNLNPFDPTNILFISLGTGNAGHKSFKYKKAKRWGMIQWVIPIIDILMSSSVDIVSYEMNKLFEGFKTPTSYYRIDPQIIYGSDTMDDGSLENMKALIKDANKYIIENKEMLDNLAKIIYNNKKK